MSPQAGLSPATFYVHGRHLVQLYEEPGRVAAHVLLENGRVHMSASSGAERGGMLEEICRMLGSLEWDERSRPQLPRRDPHGA